MTDKTVYHEELLVSQLLLDENLLTEIDVEERHFSHPLAKAIFRAIVKCSAQGITADVRAVSEMDTSLPLSKLEDLLENCPTTANYTYYQGEVKRAYRKRQLKRLGNWLVEHEGGDDEAIEYVQDQMTELLREDAADRIYDRREMVHAGIEEIERRYKNGGKLVGIQTGFRGLDKKINGYKPRLLYYVGGRPSVGKSAILLNMADHVALSTGDAVGFISIESSREELLMRTFSSTSGIASDVIDVGAMTPARFTDLMGAAEEIAKGPMYMYDVPNQSIAKVSAVARQMVQRHGCKILFIDYLQLIKAPGNDKREQVAEASTTLKQLARTLNVPVVCAAQLKRDADDHRPVIGDFQHASQIEQDADVAMLLHPEEQHQDTVAVSLNIAKCRDGSTGVVQLVFNKSVVQFRELAQGD